MNRKYRLPKLNGTKEEVALAKVIRQRLLDEVECQPQSYDFSVCLKFIKKFKEADIFIELRKLPYVDFAMYVVDNGLIPLD